MQVSYECAAPLFQSTPVHMHKRTCAKSLPAANDLSGASGSRTVNAVFLVRPENSAACSELCSAELNRRTLPMLSMACCCWPSVLRSLHTATLLPPATGLDVPNCCSDVEVPAAMLAGTPKKVRVQAADSEAARSALQTYCNIVRMLLIVLDGCECQVACLLTWNNQFLRFHPSTWLASLRFCCH